MCRSVCRVDVAIFGFRQEEQADDKGARSNDDGVPQAVIDVAVLRHQSEGDGGQQAAEPAVADVIGQAHRGVADAGREQLDQRRRNRPVHHGDENHQQRQDGDHHRQVHLRRVGLGRVARRLERGADFFLQRGLFGLEFIGRQILGADHGDGLVANLNDRRAGARHGVVVGRVGRQHLLGDVAG